LASETIREDTYRPADQLSADAIADAERRFAPVAVEALIGEVVEIAYNGIKRQVRVDANGRVAANAEPRHRGWVVKRRTFAGDAKAFMAAKRARVGLLPRQ
jgi:hypothetical protein